MLSKKASDLMFRLYIRFSLKIIRKLLFRVFCIYIFCASGTVKTKNRSGASQGRPSQAPLPPPPLPPPRMRERSTAPGEAVGRVLLAVDNSAFGAHEPVQAYSFESLLQV